VPLTGALSNMQKFFDVLRDNLETIDDEGPFVEPKNDLMMATEPYADQPNPSFNRRPIQGIQHKDWILSKYFCSSLAIFLLLFSINFSTFF